MSRKFDTPVDLLQFPLQNLVLEPVAGNPGTTPADGRVWYDTTGPTAKAQLSGTTVDLRARGTMTGTQTAATISDFATAVQALRWASMTAPNASVAMNAQQFSGLATASSSGQAVEYAQFQTAISNVQVGMDFKEHADIVALANTSVASPGATINGRAMAAGDRVLLTAQTTGSQNGLWTWNGAAVTMTRPADSPTGNTSAILAGTVLEGYNGTTRTLYMQTATGTGTNAAITVDTDTQTWTTPFVFSVTAGYGVAVTSGTKVAFNPGTGMAATGADGATAGIDTSVVLRKKGGVVPTSTGGIFTVGATSSYSSGFTTVTINHALNNLCPDVIVRYGTAGADPGQEIEVDNKPASSGTDANNLIIALPDGFVTNQFQVTVLG